MPYVVTAPYVTLKVLDAQSGKHVMLGFYADAPVPSNVDPDSLRAHVEGGMVAEVPDEPTEAERLEAEAAAEAARIEAEKEAEAEKAKATKSTAKPAK